MKKGQILGLIVAIAILALALGVTIGYSIFSSRTTTYITTGSDLYEVDFIQQAATCPPSIPEYVAPWTVTLGNQSKTEPSNGSAPEGAGGGSSYGVYSKISFLVPNGVYDYNATPDDNGYTPFEVSTPANPNGAYSSVTGTLTVRSSNVTVEIGPAEVYCSAAANTTSTASRSSLSSSIVQNESSGVVLSDVNASSACTLWEAYNSSQTGSAFGVLLSNIQSYPKYVTLEGNRSGYTYTGGGCGTSGLEVVFGYVDTLHPFKVCGNSTAWPSYQITVQVDLTSIGYDLSLSNFRSVYYSPQNTTVLCTVSTSVSSNG